MASSVDPVSQSAIPGYRLSALVCILVCLIRFRGRDEETTSSRNCCIADGNIGIGPINQSCGWLLRWRWDVCRKSLLLVWDYVRHPSVPGQNFEKSSARAGYTRLQGIRTLRTAEAAVKKLLLTSIAALLLATGGAHAQMSPSPPTAGRWQIIATSVPGVVWLFNIYTAQTYICMAEHLTCTALQGTPPLPRPPQ